MKYFAGSPTDLGTVSALPFKLFSELKNWLERPALIQHTREEFHALSAKERNHLKRVAYITPAAFSATPCARRSEYATRCYLIALDIDDSAEATRLLKQGWSVLGAFGFVVWHTASSLPTAPRIRVLVSADGLAVQRYDSAVHTIAEMLGLITVTTESLVPVQPMFLPTAFKGDSASPIIAANFEGDAFTVGDIIDAGELTQGVDATPTDNEVVDIAFLSAPVDGLTLKDAEEALVHLDPDCPMQEWIETAAGLRHQFQDKDAEAYTLWDEWSAKGKKYVDSEETAYRWSTLKAQPKNRAPVTMRSVLRRAAARGWNNAKLGHRAYDEVMNWLTSSQRSTEELNDQAVKKIAKISPLVKPLERVALLDKVRGIFKSRNMPVPMGELKRELKRIEMDEARSVGIPPWARNICYVTALDRFYRPAVDRRFKPEVLDLMYSPPKIGDEAMRARDYLVKVVGVPQVENLRYEPAMGEKRYITIDDVPFINTYRASTVKSQSDRADEAGVLFTSHISKLIADPKNEAVLLSYLAYLHQHPGKKIRWAPVIQSTKGAGKTLIAVALRATLGTRNVRKIDPAIVMDSKHNDWAYGSQIVVMEEVRIVGANRHAVMDRLKPCISDDEICVRRMYEPPQTVPNATNFLMFTNYHDALAVQEDERRYFILSSPLQRSSDVNALGGEKYFTPLFEMIRDNAGGLKSFFENYKLSAEFNPDGRAPLTRHFHELVLAAASPLAAAIQLAVTDQPIALVRSDLVSVTALRKCLSSMEVGHFSDQAVCSVLREMGWSRLGRMLLQGERHSVWSSTPMPDGYDFAGTMRERVEIIG